MLKHCVVGVDYSEGWNEIPAQLPEMIKQLGIEQLTLIYVIEPFRRKHIEDSEGAAIKRLEALAGEMAGPLGVSIDCEVRQGFAASEILQAAKKREANGVIVLNRSHSVGREIFMGNIAMNLARMTKLPLLILSQDGTPPPSQSPIILATDGSDNAAAARAQFESLMHNGSNGLVLWVEPEEHDDGMDDAEPALLSTLAEQFGNAQARRLRGYPVEQIIATAEDEDALLVIIGKRGRTPIEELILGSTAEGVARECRQPVLLTP